MHWGCGTAHAHMHCCPETKSKVRPKKNTPGPALEGFVGGMMGTAEALRVPSGVPMGIGIPCDMGSGSRYKRGGIGRIPSSSTGGIWGLMGPCPCPGIRRLDDPDLS